MFCHKCGQESPEGSAFCQKCGEKLIKDETVSQVPFTPTSEPSPITGEAVPAITSGRFENIALLGRVLSGISFLLLLLGGFFGLPINPVIIVVGVALGIILSAFGLKRPLRVNKIIELGIAGFLLVGGIVYAVSSSGDEYIEMVKGGTLEAYPQMTVGEAFDNFLSDPEWESGVSEEGGERYVTVRGRASYLDEDADFAVQFLVNEDDETFVYYAFEINELPQNDLVFWNLLDVAYSEGAVSAAAASPDTSGASSSGNRIEIGETQSFSNSIYGDLEVTLVSAEFTDRMSGFSGFEESPEPGNIFLLTEWIVKNIGTTPTSSFSPGFSTIVYDETYEFTEYVSDPMFVDMAPLSPPETLRVYFTVSNEVAESDKSLVIRYSETDWDDTYNEYLSFIIRSGTGDSAGQGALGGNGEGVLTFDEAQGMVESWMAAYQFSEHMLLPEADINLGGEDYYHFDLRFDGPDVAPHITSICVNKTTGELISYNWGNETYEPLEDWYNNSYGSESSDTPQESNSSYMMVNTGGDNLNMRIAPGPSFEVIGQIPNGEVVEIIGFEGEWASVMYDDYNGWVAQEYLVPIQ